jgi:hypothetical protein
MDDVLESFTTQATVTLHRRVISRDDFAQSLGIEGPVQEIGFNEEDDIVFSYLVRAEINIPNSSDLDEPYWFRDWKHISSDGRVIPLRDMHDTHLENTFRKYGRRAYELELAYRAAL